MDLLSLIMGKFLKFCLIIFNRLPGHYVIVAVGFNHTDQDMFVLQSFMEMSQGWAP